MPNWCYNSIEVIGDKTDLEAFDKRFQQDRLEFNFATINSFQNAPMSAVLEAKANALVYRENPDDDNAVYVTDIYESDGYSFSNFIEPSVKDILDGWYEWRIHNWGTKWDTGDIEMFDHSDGSIHYALDTAWSPCIPVVNAMAKKFPMLKFKYIYEEGGEDFAGKIVYENGIILSDNYYKGNARKQFMQDEGMEDFLTCEDCGELLYEYILEDYGCCSECESKNITDKFGDKVDTTEYESEEI